MSSLISKDVEMSTHLPKPGLLSLPYELRFEIYQIVLDQRLGYYPDTHLAISAVNRQLREEVLPLILQGNRYFRSLEKLSEWTIAGEPHLLEQIQNITVHVFDDSLSSVTEALAANTEDASTNVSMATRFWRTMSAPQIGRLIMKPVGRQSLRMRILDTLGLTTPPVRKAGSGEDAITRSWNAFRAIKNVKKLWILFKDSTHPSSRRAFLVEQELIIDIIASSCQHVEDLTIFSDLVSLDYLAHFQDLHQLRFSGYSKSSPEETLNILKGLKKLDSIIIYRYPEIYDADHNITTSKLPEYLSLTPAVLASMNPIKLFNVSHMSSVLPSQHMTVPMFQSLRAHLPWLRILQLSSDFPLDEDIVEELISFLGDSRITDLRIRVKIPSRFEKMDVNAFFPKTCKHGEAATRNANVPNLVHLAMTASGASHNITHVNRQCICNLS